MSKYTATIGLEVHVQLKTRSKMFCACPVEYGASANSHTCPVCLGMPGALPVMNEQALIMTAQTGLMLDCHIAPVCKFDRKNYFYPDMPKNYQISQYDLPICVGGGVPLHDLAYPKDAQKSIANPGKKVGLVRIHLEEDVAKSFHFETTSGIDFNRAGTPLMEIVTEPAIDSPEEAFAFLTSLKQILEYGQVSDADMEKGQLRCDCNVSVRPEGQEKLGTKVEIKNMNSISGVRRAVTYEIRRQIEVLEGGGRITQQTRGWDDDAGETYEMRSKEQEHDYRYFPDPDLLPVKTEELVAEAKRRVPELPHQKRDRFVAHYEVTVYDASVIAADQKLAEYFEAAAKASKKPKSVANWILNDLLGALAAAEMTIEACPIPPEGLRELVQLIEEGRVNSKQAKEVFGEMFSTGRKAGAIVDEKGFAPLDTGLIEQFCDQVIAANPKPVADYKAGNPAPLNFLKGQVMKLSKGTANPQQAGEILARKLAE